MSDGTLRSTCVVLAVGAILAGMAGMLLSYLYLASSHPADIASGQSGFVAGAVLIGSGLVSLSLLARQAGSVQGKGAASS
jgi:hypothetical protein